MNINIKATGIELTPAISAYVHKKISTLSKYLDKRGENNIVRVEIGKTTKHHKEGSVYKAEVHITGNGQDVYAVADTFDLYAAIDMVENEVAHVLLSQKGRRTRLLRRGERTIKRMTRGINPFNKKEKYIEE